MPEEGMPRSLRIGGCSKEELRSQLEAAGVSLNPAAERLFEDDRWETASDVRRVKIRTISVAELGLAEGATYQQCVALARELGYSECPLELAAALRLAYADQPVAPERPADAEPGSPPGAITVASAPLDASEETPRGFYLRNINGTLWLRGYWSDDEHVWAPGDLFVFMRNEG